MSQDHQNIELASFLVRAKPTLQKILITIIIAVEIGLAIFVGFVMVKAFQERMSAVAMVGNFQQVKNLVTSRASAAQPPQIVGTTTLSRGAGNIDAIAILQNPNADWIIHLTPHFQTADGSTTALGGTIGLEEVAIMPLSKYVVGNFGLPASAGEPQFQVQKIRYEKIDRHLAADASAYRASRDQLTFANELYSLADTSVIDDRLHVDITNNSPFGFYDFQIQVLMYVDSSIVGFEQISLEQFTSGQTRPLDIHSSPRGIKPTRIEYIPITNYFDPSSFLKVSN